MSTILVAPLNWGMGHATRCIPIIHELINQNHNVILASDGRAYNLLKNELPDLQIILLPGYNIIYQKYGSFIINLAMQIPKMFYAAYKEQQVLKRIIKNYKIDAIISDNRFGLFSSDIPCVFISHQLNVLPEREGDLLSTIARELNFLFISRFTECWIPDYAGSRGITGNLIITHKNVHFKYLGIISRFKNFNFNKKYDVLVILSGPEPQRTILENILIKQLLLLKVKVIFVKGVTETNNKQTIGNIEIHDHMTSEKLNEAVCSSDLVISRTGHTTVMDLIATNTRGLLIPTPGQPEQEYLGRFLHDNGLFYCVSQDKINLEVDIMKALSLKRRKYIYDSSQYKNIIKEWLAKIN